jgi:hypothetical protein
MNDCIANPKSKGIFESARPLGLLHLASDVGFYN